MSKSNSTLTAERLRELLHFDPETGVFTNRIERSPRARAGERAGANSGKGYKSVRINRRGYLAHRLAWLYVYGRWPDDQIDHIDGNRSNNSISNLRDVSRGVNQQNRKARSTNHARLLGVGPTPKGRFRAMITIHGVQHYLGTFDTADAAQAKYLSVKRLRHEGCTI